MGYLRSYSQINVDTTLAGTTPTLTIGDGDAEDASLLFDGNAQDFHVGLDDTADDLVIGVGTALGTTTAISVNEDALTTIHADMVVSGATPTVTIGDAGEEDAKVIFDGHQKDFYVGLDDSADEFVIGLGSTVGTNPAITITGDGTENVTIGGDLTISGNDIIGAGNMGLGTAAVSTKDGILHVESTVNGTPALVVEMPSSATANGIQFHTGGTSAVDIYIKSTATCVCLNTRDLGNDGQGPQLNLGRNSNSSQASGAQIKFFDLGGDGHFLHVDNSGIVRVGTTNPIGSEDTTNTIVGTQSSYQFHSDGSPNKDIIRELTPSEGLEAILPTKFYEGSYTSGSYNGGTFFWPLAEEAPHLMEDPNNDLPGGRAHSPISHASLNSLAIQELHNKIEVLKNEIISLHRDYSVGSAVALNN